MSVFSVKEITEDGQEVAIAEDGSTQPAVPTPQEVQLSFCYLISGYADARTSILDTKQCRPKCQCICGCDKRPGKGCRRQCSRCNALVGPGCCWVPERQMCHVCDWWTEPDPEPSDATLSWTFPAFDATNDTIVQIFLGESHHGPCLLVDTGAFQNIAGSFWAQKIQEILGQEGQPSIKWKRLDNPHPVSGVGKDIVYANWTASIPIMFPGGRKTTFNTLYMETASVQASWEWKLLEEQSPFWTSELGSFIYTAGTPRMSPSTFQKEVTYRGCSWCSPQRAISYFRVRSLAPGTPPPNHHDKPLRSHDVIATVTRHTSPDHQQLHKTFLLKRSAYAPTRR